MQIGDRVKPKDSTDKMTIIKISGDIAVCLRDEPIKSERFPDMVIDRAIVSLDKLELLTSNPQTELFK